MNPPEHHTYYKFDLDSATETIERLYETLSRRSKIKKSDLKEAVSDLLGFTSSNEFDTALKTRKLEIRGRCVFDRRGRLNTHLETLLIPRNANQTIKNRTFIEKHPNHEFVIDIGNPDEFRGLHSSLGYTVVTSDTDKAIKGMLEWETNASVRWDGSWWEFEYYDQDNNKLITNCSDELYGNLDMLACSNACPTEVKEAFFRAIADHNEFPFYIYTRDFYIDSVIHNEMGEDFEYGYRKATTFDDFISLVELYLPHMGMNRIEEVAIERCTSVELNALEVKYSAEFTRPVLLEIALQAGRRDAYHYLVERGQDIQNARLILNHEDMVEETPVWPRLYRRVHYGSEQYFRCLSDIGINEHILTNDIGRSHLHYAAMNIESFGAYEYLVERGADTNLKDINGRTPNDIKRDIEYIKSKRRETTNYEIFVSQEFGLPVDQSLIDTQLV